MKKALSLYLVIFCLLAPQASVFSQKSRFIRNDVSERKRSKTVADDVKANDSEFAGLNAIATEDGVLIRWEMQKETGVIGYYVHRVDPNGDNVVNSEIVFGSSARVGTQPLYGETYGFIDRSGTHASSYYIELLDLNGDRLKSRTTAPVFAKRFPVSTSSFPNNVDTPGTIESSQLKESTPSIPKELAANIEGFSSQADAAKHKWVMGRVGARIDVKSEGIYRVTFAQLQTAGFVTSGSKANWQLYLSGVEQAITINEAAEYVEFYGKGVDTVESDIQGYFLVVGDTPGKRIQNLVARPSNSTAFQQSYNQTFVYKERLNYLDQILNGPLENYWGRAIGAGGTNITFALNAIDFNRPTSTIEIKVQGYTLGSHIVRPTLNGQVLDPLTGVSQFPMQITLQIPTSLLKDASLGQGNNVLNLASVGPSGDFNVFDSFYISFARKQAAAQNALKAYALDNRKSNLTGFASANVRVFDISRENEVRVMTNLPFQDQGGTFGVVLPAARGKVYYAVEDTAIKAPVAVSASDGEVLETSSFGADLIIIAYKDFLTQAQAWANYRTGQGHSVKVVNVDEVFNEFNYGVLSSNSIEKFLEHTFYFWSPSPKYVLLVGDASYDSRNYQGIGFFNYVPTRLVTTVFSETGSDEALADFDDNGLAEIPIGRIPARTGTEITNALAKVTNWEANLPVDPLSRGFLFSSHWDNNTPGDPLDPETLFQEMSKRIRDELPAGTSSTMMNSLNNTKSQLLGSMNSGKYFVNYTGHGSMGVWIDTNFFWSGDVPSLTNHNNESVYTSLSCLNGYFLHVNNTSLAEVLLQHGNGGAVAVWSSTGLTTPDIQEVMARRFYNRLGAGTFTRLGDFVKDAKSTITGGNDVRLSFALLGDPMLKVR